MGPIRGLQPASALREQELQSSLEGSMGWQRKGCPCVRGPSIITRADVTDPTKQLGPQMQGNPNPSDETDRGRALLYNAWALLLLALPQEPLSPGPLGLKPLSFPTNSAH